MKKVCLFLLAIGLFFSGSVDAQKNVQGKLVYLMMEELVAQNGPESLASLRHMKTKSQFANYLRMKAKTCRNCPVLEEFTKGLSASPKIPNGIPPRVGAKDAADCPPPTMTKAVNFGAKVLAFYDENIYGVDDETEIKGCGPLYGLSRWGCPLPCRGLCPRDPMELPAEEEEEQGEEFGYDDY